MVDIFEHGNTVLRQKNIISIRKKRKLRLKRHIDFFDEVNNTVIEQSENAFNELLLTNDNYVFHQEGNDLWNRYNIL